MKCRLVQILAVAMVLGHTVLTPFFKVKVKWVEEIPNLKTDEYLLSITKVTKSKHGVVKSIDTLRSEFSAIKTQFADVNFELFNDKNIKKIHAMIDKLYDIRGHVKRFRHKEKSTLLKEVNNEIDSFVTNLRNAMDDAEKDIEQNKNYQTQIIDVIDKIDKFGSFYGEILPIRDAGSKVGIEFPNTKICIIKRDEKKLRQVEDILDDRIADKRIILNEMYNLLWYIARKNLAVYYDTRNTELVRNVIGISIAVCAIATLCIVLLIAVHNKNRTNAEVRLVNWV